MVVLYGCVGKGVLVIVNNNSGASISNLKVEYTGGSVGTDKVDNNQTYKSFVNPQSESHLEIQFIDNHGKVVRKKVDVYFEKNYKGNIDITIKKDYELAIKSDVQVN